eukprot:gene18048-24467_t
MIPCNRLREASSYIYHFNPLSPMERGRRGSGRFRNFEPPWSNSARKEKSKPKAQVTQAPIGNSKASGEKCNKVRKTASEGRADFESPAPCYAASSYNTASYSATSYTASSYTAASYTAACYTGSSYNAASYTATSYTALSCTTASCTAASYTASSSNAASSAAASYAASSSNAASYTTASYTAASTPAASPSSEPPSKTEDYVGFFKHFLKQCVEELCERVDNTMLESELQSFFKLLYGDQPGPQLFAYAMIIDRCADFQTAAEQCYIKGRLDGMRATQPSNPAQNPLMQPLYQQGALMQPPNQHGAVMQPRYNLWAVDHPAAKRVPPQKLPLQTPPPKQLPPQSQLPPQAGQANLVEPLAHPLPTQLTCPQTLPLQSCIPKLLPHPQLNLPQLPPPQQPTPPQLPPPQPTPPLQPTPPQLTPQQSHEKANLVEGEHAPHNQEQKRFLVQHVLDLCALVNNPTQQLMLECNIQPLIDKLADAQPDQQRGAYAFMIKWCSASQTPAEQHLMEQRLAELGAAQQSGPPHQPLAHPPPTQLNCLLTLPLQSCIPKQLPHPQLTLPQQSHGQANLVEEEHATAQGEEVQPVHLDRVPPVQPERVLPALYNGLLPVQVARVSPIRPVGVLQAPSDGLLPIQLNRVPPTQPDGVLPAPYNGRQPVQHQAQALAAHPFQPGFLVDPAPARLEEEEHAPFNQEQRRFLEQHVMDLCAQVNNPSQQLIFGCHIQPLIDKLADAQPDQQRGVYAFMIKWCSASQTPAEQHLMEQRLAELGAAQQSGPPHQPLAHPPPTQLNCLLTLPLQSCIPKQLPHPQLTLPQQSHGQANLVEEEHATAQGEEVQPVHLDRVPPVQPERVLPALYNGLLPVQVARVPPIRPVGVLQAPSDGLLPIQLNRVPPTQPDGVLPAPYNGRQPVQHQAQALAAHPFQPGFLVDPAPARLEEEEHAPFNQEQRRFLEQHVMDLCAQVNNPSQQLIFGCHIQPLIDNLADAQPDQQRGVYAFMIKWCSASQTPAEQHLMEQRLAELGAAQQSGPPHQPLAHPPPTQLNCLLTLPLQSCIPKQLPHPQLTLPQQSHGQAHLVKEEHATAHGEEVQLVHLDRVPPVQPERVLPALYNGLLPVQLARLPPTQPGGVLPTLSDGLLRVHLDRVPSILPVRVQPAPSHGLLPVQLDRVPPIQPDGVLPAPYNGRLPVQHQAQTLTAHPVQPGFLVDPAPARLEEEEHAPFNQEQRRFLEQHVMDLCAQVNNPSQQPIFGCHIQPLIDKLADAQPDQQRGMYAFMINWCRAFQTPAEQHLMEQRLVELGAAQQSGPAQQPLTKHLTPLQPLAYPPPTQVTCPPILSLRSWIPKQLPNAQPTLPQQSHGQAHLVEEEHATAQGEEVQPVHLDRVPPIRLDVLLPAPSDGLLPVHRDRGQPIRPDGVLPAPSDGVLPVHLDRVPPIRPDGVIPAPYNDLLPVQDQAQTLAAHPVQTDFLVGAAPAHLVEEEHAPFNQEQKRFLKQRVKDLCTQVNNPPHQLIFGSKIQPLIDKLADAPPDQQQGAYAFMIKWCIASQTPAEQHLMEQRLVELGAAQQGGPAHQPLVQTSPLQQTRIQTLPLQPRIVKLSTDLQTPAEQHPMEQHLVELGAAQQSRPVQQPWTTQHLPPHQPLAHPPPTQLTCPQTLPLQSCIPKQLPHTQPTPPQQSHGQANLVEPLAHPLLTQQTRPQILPLQSCIPKQLPHPQPTPPQQRHGQAHLVEEEHATAQGEEVKPVHLDRVPPIRLDGLLPAPSDGLLPVHRDRGQTRRPDGVLPVQLERVPPIRPDGAILALYNDLLPVQDQAQTLAAHPVQPGFLVGAAQAHLVEEEHAPFNQEQKRFLEQHVKDLCAQSSIACSSTL